METIILILLNLEHDFLSHYLSYTYLDIMRQLSIVFCGVNLMQVCIDKALFVGTTKDEAQQCYCPFSFLSSYKKKGTARKKVFKMKSGNQLQNNLSNSGIHNLNSVMIFHVLVILASQNRFQSLYDEIYNIDRFLD